MKEELKAAKAELDAQNVTVTPLISFYDQEEIHKNCTVQILTNTKTGDVSIGWWENTQEEEPSEEDEFEVDEDGYLDEDEEDDDECLD